MIDLIYVICNFRMDNGDELSNDRIKRLRDVQQALVIANEQAEQHLLQELRTHASLRQEVERVRSEMERQDTKRDKENL